MSTHMLKDKDIREPLFDYFEMIYGKCRTIEEKRIKRSRADVMLVTEGALIGVEIKSDADTYTRLARQVPDYNRFFDYNYIVVGSSHAAHVGEHVPDWWGIICVATAEDKLTFQCLREAEPNPKRQRVVKLRNQLSILWRRELVHMQALNGMPKYSEKSKDFVIKKLAEVVDEPTLKRQISDELFERDYTTIEESIAEYRKAHGSDGRTRGRRPKRRKAETQPPASPSP